MSRGNFSTSMIDAMRTHLFTRSAVTVGSLCSLNLCVDKLCLRLSYLVAREEKVISFVVNGCILYHGRLQK